MCLALTSGAQSTTPRYGITTSADNTGRVLTYGWNATADHAGTDTIKFTPAAWETIVRPGTLVDSVAYKITSVKNSYAGDRMTFIVTAPSGGGVFKFVGSNIKTGSSGARISMAANTRATISFIFDGAYWVELHRVTGQ